MSKSKFSVYKRPEADEFVVGSPVVRGVVACVHGFDVEPRGIVTHHLDPQDRPDAITDEAIRQAVLAHRRCGQGSARACAI